MGAMLIVGSAPCLYDDVKRALDLRPFAEAMTINGACAALEWPGHMLCGHEEKTAEFVRARLNAFPGKLPRVHATYPRMGGPKPDAVRVAEYRQTYPQVNSWWPLEMGGHAGSAGKAINIARALGFDEVILCGCPMDGSGYFPGEGDGFDPRKPGSGGIRQSMNCLRIGDGGLARGYPKPGTNGTEWMKVQETRLVQGYRDHFAELAKSVFSKGVYSMSGFTRDQVGLPPKEA